MKQRNVHSVLAALASVDECESLRKILGSTGWNVRFVRSVAEARARLRASPPGVVITARHFAEGCSWQDVLAELQRMAAPPPLIVADRLADEALWAEVLNLGCYDLLATPFEPAEVLRVVPMACAFRERQSHPDCVRPMPPGRAERSAWPRAKAIAAGSVGVN